MQQSSRIRELEVVEKSLSARVTFASTETKDVKTREEALLTQKQATEERLNTLAVELVEINETVEQLSKVKLQGRQRKMSYENSLPKTFTASGYARTNVTSSNYDC